MIRTDRLELRPFTVETATATVSGDQEGAAWAAGFPGDDDREAARMFLQAPNDIFGVWCIVETQTGEVVGTIGFYGPPGPDGDLMVGYGLVPQARGQGYATEALRAIAEYGLAQPGVARILADPDPTNVASHRVLEKSGFQIIDTTATALWYARAR